MLMQGTSPTVALSAVSKSYGDVTALNNVDLEIFPGHIFGVLGPNGSGKSTMLKLISSVIQPDHGKVRVLGRDCSDEYVWVRHHVGFVPENSVIYESLSATEYLSLVSSVYGIETRTSRDRISALSDALATSDIMDELVGSLSFGNRQKISIIAALVHDPEVIILDEPTKGLDPRSFRIFKDVLSMLAKRGKTIVFSTHVLEIAEELCERLCIMYRGEIRASGLVSDFVGTGKDRRRLEETFFRITGETSLESLTRGVGRAFA